VDEQYEEAEENNEALDTITDAEFFGNFAHDRFVIFEKFENFGETGQSDNFVNFAEFSESEEGVDVCLGAFTGGHKKVVNRQNTQNIEPEPKFQINYSNSLVTCHL